MASVRAFMHTYNMCTYVYIQYDIMYIYNIYIYLQTHGMHESCVAFSCSGSDFFEGISSCQGGNREWFGGGLEGIQMNSVPLMRRYPEELIEWNIYPQTRVQKDNLKELRPK